MSHYTVGFTYYHEDLENGERLRVDTNAMQSNSDAREWRTTIEHNGRRLSILLPCIPDAATLSEENKIVLRTHNAIVHLLHDHAQPEDIFLNAEEIILPIIEKTMTENAAGTNW